MMNLSQSLLPEFEHEMANTRRSLERIPTDKFGYKPHPRSGTMGWLASHIAMIPLWGSTTLTTDELAVDDYQMPPEPASSEDLLATFDTNVASFREALKQTSDETLMAEWKITRGGKALMQMPRIAMLRGMIFNHLVHHRGELMVYLRLNDISVPALYGPSADEGTFGASA